jgi:hypothetical protein
MGATSGLVSSFTYAGVLLGPPVIFSTLYDGGATLRIVLVVVAVAVQVLPLPLGPLARRPTQAEVRSRPVPPR